MRKFKPLAAAAAALALLCLAAPAGAVINARDDVPATTLLFPYFEVDIDDPDGANTQMTWRNTSASAILTHVSVYSDVGIRVLNFNVYLTGYDAVTLDLRAMLVDGILPVTASAGQDPGNLISPKGIFSQDINFASCYDQLPYPTPVLFPATIDNLQAQLTGQPSTLTALCAGFDHGDSTARGYITLDTVNNCTQRSPGDPGYFASGGSGDATIQNTLAGEYLLFGRDARMVHSGPAVAIEGSFTDPEVTNPGEYTFYGRNTAYTAIDNREALTGTWAVDQQAAGGELIVWRDTMVQAQPFACDAAGPAGAYPLDQEAIIAFDRQAQATLPTPGARPFALATQRVRFADAVLPPVAKTGWIYLGLGLDVPGAASPAEDPQASQSYVTVVQYPESGGVGGSGAAFSLDAAGNAPVHDHPRTLNP